MSGRFVAHLVVPPLPRGTRRKKITVDRTELDQLPPLVDLPTAARVLGIGRTLAYELVKADRWPTTSPSASSVFVSAPQATVNR